MDREKQREIARKGGKMAHEKGTAHEWSVEEARVAGRKGGLKSSGSRRQAASELNPRTDTHVVDAPGGPIL
jgi:general stress protein YciG